MRQSMNMTESAAIVTVPMMFANCQLPVNSWPTNFDLDLQTFQVGANYPSCAWHKENPPQGSDFRMLINVFISFFNAQVISKMIIFHNNNVNTSENQKKHVTLHVSLLG